MKNVEINWVIKSFKNDSDFQDYINTLSKEKKLVWTKFKIL